MTDKPKQFDEVDKARAKRDYDLYEQCYKSGQMSYKEWLEYLEYIKD